MINKIRINNKTRGLKQYNEVFGHNATVDFSDAWKKGYEKYMTELNNNEGGAENV